jgi:hypothetical protein
MKQKMTTASVYRDREVHGIAGTVNRDRGIRFAFRAVGHECELAHVYTMPARVTSKIF